MPVLTNSQREADNVCMQMAAAAPASRDMPGKPVQGQRATRDREAAQKPARHLRGGSAAAQEGGIRAKTARSQDLPCQQPTPAAELERDSPRPSSLPTKGHKVLARLGSLCLYGMHEDTSSLLSGTAQLSLGLGLLMVGCVGRAGPTGIGNHFSSFTWVMSAESRAACRWSRCWLRAWLTRLQPPCSRLCKRRRQA